MKETHEFLVPDYFPEFKCKMGACRHSCCEGWPVTVSLEEYFRLLNVECGTELRERIDASLRLLPQRTPDEYAEISHDYTGQCQLRMADGRCALHAEAGEDALAPLCRLYPRGVRSEGGFECACACSCEKTLELLAERKTPLRFIPQAMTIDMPENPGRSVRFETFGREQEIRLYFIGIIQDRRSALYERLIRLSDAIAAMEGALKEKHEAAINALLYKDFVMAHAASSSPQTALAFGLEIARQLVEIMDAHSAALRDYGQAALTYFGSGETALERYRSARAGFETAFPDWETFFENMLVNHMFFSRFPVQDRPDSLSAEKIALDAIYALLRFTGIGCGARTLDELIDIYHAVFRLIDHTDFDRYAGRLLEKLGCGTADKQRNLLML